MGELDGVLVFNGVARKIFFRCQARPPQKLASNQSAATEAILNKDQLERARALQAHCQEMAIQRMWAVTTEAIGVGGKGWTVELLQEWTAYNANLVLLMNSTRKLLPF